MSILKVALYQFLLIFASSVYASNGNMSMHLSFEDKNTKQESMYILNQNDIEYVRTSAFNQSLLLDKEKSIRLEPPKTLSTKSGAISFWVKPEWDYKKKSHTFLSMQWDGEESSYMVISSGWWEPAGKSRLYFVLSNRDRIHCSIPYQFEQNVWTMVTASWEAGERGHCSIYVNDEILISKKHAQNSDRKAKSELYLNSDIGSGVLAGRSQKTLYDSLSIYEESLSHLDIISFYKKTKSQIDVNVDSRYSWMQEVLTQPYQPIRNAKGEILESRIIFDEDIKWALSKRNTNNILNKIKSSGFNVYVPCVWHGKGAYYSSNVAHSNERIQSRIDKGDDPLEYLINEAHLMGIEVHPWFTVVKREDEKYPEFFDSGSLKGAYNVHDSKFRDFIVEVMLDVVNRYDVDGINLDYIRTMGICTSVHCRNDFEKFSGHNLMVDYLGRKVIGGARKRIQAWQDDAVADIVRSFSFRARSLRQDLIISVDAHPRPRAEKRPLQGRDVISWVNNGWVDIIFSMDYSQKVDIDNFEAVRAELIDSRKLLFLYGNYDKVEDRVVPRDSKLVAGYAMYTQRRWQGVGIAYYLYNLLSDEQINELTAVPFAEPAVPSWH